MKNLAIGFIIIMKNVIGYILSYFLYALGHVCSIAMHSRLWKKMARLYPYYNKLMIASFDVQDWSGCRGPWKEVGK